MSIKDAVAIRKPTAIEVLREQLTTTQALLVRSEQQVATQNAEIGQRRGELAQARSANERFHAVRSDMIGLKHALVQITSKASEVVEKLEKALQERP